MSASPAIEIEATIGDAVATMGFIPAILPTVLSARHYDALVYHQRGVLKDAKKRFPSGRRAQGFIATRMGLKGNKHRQVFGRTTGKRLPDTIEQAAGRGWMMGEVPGLLTTLERGGVRTTAEPMAIPVAARYRKKSWTKFKWQEEIERRGFQVVPGKGLSYIINPKRGAGSKTSYRLGGHEIVGVLKRRIRIRPRLGWFRRWQANLPKVLAKYDKDMAELLTASGRKAASERIAKEHNVQRAAEIGRRTFLNANPGNYVGAARAARSAAAQVKKDSVARTITVNL